MTHSSAIAVDQKCPKCTAKVNPVLRHCATCSTDLGFPNVRETQTTADVAALNARFATAQLAADHAGVRSEFDAIENTISTTSRVVVSMPLSEARGFTGDPRKIYSNYEALVDSGGRQPAPIKDDSDRRSVGGTFFGSYADEIRYGLLSLDGTGLPSYGDVFLTLRSVTIESRVSFLEENTYLFLDAHNVKVKEPIPSGYRSDWRNRGRLAATKIGPTIQKGSTIKEWQAALVAPGVDRSKDACVEAHIFGGFNIDAVETVIMARNAKNRRDQNDIDVVIEQFDEIKKARGVV